MTTTVTLNDRQLATVLAALRSWQNLPRTSPAHEQIASDDGKFDPLTDDEIDDLCQNLNAGHVPAEPVIEIMRKVQPGEVVVEYEVTEAVRYRRKMVFTEQDFVDGDHGETVERDWIENGDPIKDLVAVDDREIESIYMLDETSGKYVAAHLFR